MSDAQAEEFWPVYLEYRTEVLKLNDELVELIKRFADDIDRLTEAQAKSLTEGSLRIDKERVALKTKYVRRYAKVLSGVQTARVLQVENKLDAIFLSGMAKSVPLVSLPGQ
ncbi:MAG: hypothetical protein HC809_00670 [Gammaproteobacteria bacterium]|nr:hypothetical protein [Gammaproteobacteria bacterium]